MPTPKKPATADHLTPIFDSLEKLFRRYSPPFKLTNGKIRAKRDLHLTVPKPVVVPGAYANKPVAIDMASLILQKGYVGFYFMPIYIQPTLKKKLSPALLSHLKGKTCFNIKKLYPDLLPAIESALNEGLACFQSRNWLPT
jgi:hypothetical protein